MEVLKRIIYILKKLSAKDHICENTDLTNNLGLDSLDMVMLLMEIETEFDIELDESDMNPFKLRRVSDIVELVERYIVTK